MTSRGVAKTIAERQEILLRAAEGGFLADKAIAWINAPSYDPNEALLTQEILAEIEALLGAPFYDIRDAFDLFYVVAFGGDLSQREEAWSYAKKAEIRKHANPGWAYRAIKEIRAYLAERESEEQS